MLKTLRKGPKDNAPKEQWPLLYYILAALNLCTIIFGIIFFHYLLELHSRSVAINAEWIQRFESFEQLAVSISKVNGPGNDVFESHNVASESARLQAYRAGFEAVISSLKQDTDGLTERQRLTLAASFAAIEGGIAEMADEAKKIFQHFDARESREAGQHMATMDRRFAATNRYMAQLRQHAREFQKEALVEQRNKARDLGILEFIFAGFAFAVIAFTSFYGHEMSKRLRANRKIIEDQKISIQASAKLSALGEMAGGIAHEINNPLAIIQMRAVHLREVQKRGEMSQALLAESAEAIERMTDRIACIIRGLRTFARDARKDPFKQELVAKVIEETLSICRERFRHRNIRLEVIVSCPEAAVECRATEISQVLLNLLNNAADAVAGSPEAWVLIEALEQAEGVEVRVTDSGRGIPSAIREKMMQPFFTTKEVGKGTGLGLSISKGIVDSHRGQLWYEPGLNTRFVVRLPKTQNSQRTRSA